ncbi:MAG: SAM-dependent methyltransferase [Nitrospira sp.]|nr:SAM-dependent methyltransferase [Nitrospira sp.]MCP9462615.1 SAM-dependent methyltransferase [Nitrospira sp.]MCP9475052.1 SAM-dependent methyltransferase [Nitrospira sp.]
MTIGHPELVAAIASEIASCGPIPFVRFMESALYHPRFGYYMRAPEDGAERIGWNGDYYTSSDVHPILGRALARQAEQVDRLLGEPDPFTVVEAGPGKGLLARQFLTACADEFPSLRERLRYILIERSPAMRERQRQHVAPWLNEPDKLSWVNSPDELLPGSVTGMWFSNELLDAFPVHRLRVKNGRVQEVYVDYQDGGFVECLHPLSTDALAAHLHRLNPDWPDGYQTEVNLEALNWIKQVARRMHRGVVLTIDYGHTAQDLYGPERRNGTFLCYSRHSINETPFLRVGLQDMTAHVDFSSLAEAGEAEGLRVTGFTNQLSFLMGLGVEKMVEELEPESPAFRSALHLLKPNGMGGIFKVLIQHKGIECAELDGLKYKPFWASALAGSEIGAQTP